MASNLPPTRVRGIYATALSSLLARRGFPIVEASPAIAERLGLPEDGQAVVSVHDRPGRQGVWIEGESPAANVVARTLWNVLPDACLRLATGADRYDVEFPGASKTALDRERATVLPTLPGHHRFKIIAPEALTEAEAMLATRTAAPEALVAELGARFIRHVLRPGRAAIIEHVKPSGTVLRMPGQVVGWRGNVLCLARTFQPGGLYDTLAAPKLAGDHGEVMLLAGGWVSRRRYLRASGELIGELYNIQTPTELYPWGARYLDLEVDVARWPDGRVEIVDQEDLRRAVSRGYLTPRLAQRALALADALQARLRRSAAIDLAEWR